MSLYDKIMAIYPDLTTNDFISVIILVDDSDGNGAYISAWDHPTLRRPTQSELEAV